MDVADSAQAVQELNRNLALAEHAGHQPETPIYLNDVRVCRWCSQEIAPLRLEANPQAVRCVECQDRHERMGGT